MKKIAALLVVFFGPILLEGCCGDTITVLISPGETSFTNYNTSTFQTEDFPVVNFEDYAIEISFPDAHEVAGTNRLSFGTSAYATTCDDTYVYKPSIQKVTITANRDYNDMYTAGMDIAHLFDTRQYSQIDGTGYEFNDFDYFSLKAFVKEALKDSYYENKYQGGSIDRLFLLVPSVAPSYDEEYVFTITIYYQDNFTVSAHTAPIRFN